MQIELASNPIRVHGPDVEFTLSDEGGAHVFMIFSIEGVDGFEHAEANKGAKSKTITLEVGKTYDSNVFFAAHAFQALNRAYDSELRANGAPVAWAKDNIPEGQASDRKSKSFKIEVVSM